jgi:hypothetical protein
MYYGGNSHVLVKAHSDAPATVMIRNLGPGDLKLDKELHGGGIPVGAARVIVVKGELIIEQPEQPIVLEITVC